MLERNASTPPARRMLYRIGVNQGDVLFDENRIYGDGINVAARLEGLCEPGGICVSNKVYEEIKGRFDIQFHDMGEQKLKNIAFPVRTYRIQVSGAAPIPSSGLTHSLIQRALGFRHWQIAAISTALVAGAVSTWWIGTYYIHGQKVENEAAEIQRTRRKQAEVILKPSAEAATLISGERPRAKDYNPGDTFADCKACPQMIVLAPGQFMMGSPDDERGRDIMEGPRHLVEIGKPFAISQFEITVGQFAIFVKETGRLVSRQCFVPKLKDERVEWETADVDFQRPGFEVSASHAVTCTSWDDAIEFVEWLTRKTGRPYHLPSEAEWEFAARAGSFSRFSFEDRAEGVCEHANHADQSTAYSYRNATCSDGMPFTAPVGSYKPNPWGLHDMFGNAWEWVGDCWRKDYQGAPTDGSSWASEGYCAARVMRGGSWVNTLRQLRSAFRQGRPPHTRASNIGFRVAAMPSSR